MLSHAIDQKIIAEEQYSIPGKRCITQALNKRLLFDINRHQKGVLAIASCDLKSCYDRICHTPASLAIQNWGIPIEPVHSMFSTLQNIQYKTRTAYGDSTSTFGGFNKNYTAKPQGAGQGNGAAPPIWVVVSSKMFELLKMKGLTNTLYTPVSKQEMDLTGFAYVDDSDLFVLSTEGEEPEKTLQKMQSLINEWEKAAKITGGAIEPKKCWWYFLSYEWMNGVWCYKDNGDGGKLTVKDAEDTPQEMKFISSHKAQEMLGVYIAPDGNQSDQIKAFEEKVNSYCEKVRTTNLHKHEVWLGLQSIVMKSLEYALPVTTLTKEQCNRLMWKIIKAFLPRAGINAYIRRDVIFAPVECQGLGLNDIYITQGVGHVKEIIEHSWTNTVTGYFITTILEQIRLELGLNINILESNYYVYEYLLVTKTWIQHTWQFMTDYNITYADKTAGFTVYRERDSLLMEHVHSCKEISVQDKITFN